MKGSLEQAGRLTEFLIAVTILASGLTLFLILSMWIRDRKKELAIYLSMGYGKANICMQVMAEGSGILLAAFLPSVLAGGKAAGILAGGIIPDMTDFAAVQVSICLLYTSR